MKGKPLAPSNRPFREALHELMATQELSYRQLARATADIDGKGFTHAHLNMLANGHDKPSLRAMEVISAACGITPNYFAEYRIAKGHART